MIDFDKFNIGEVIKDKERLGIISKKALFKKGELLQAKYTGYLSFQVFLYKNGKFDNFILRFIKGKPALIKHDFNKADSLKIEYIRKPYIDKSKSEIELSILEEFLRYYSINLPDNLIRTDINDGLKRTDFEIDGEGYEITGVMNLHYGHGRLRPTREIPALMNAYEEMLLILKNKTKNKYISSKGTHYNVVNIIFRVDSNFDVKELIEEEISIFEHIQDKWKINHLHKFIEFCNTLWINNIFVYVLTYIRLPKINRGLYDEGWRPYVIKINPNMFNDKDGDNHG